MAAGIFRRRQQAPNHPLRVNPSHPLAAGLGFFGWAVGANRVWNARTGAVIDLSASAGFTGTFMRGAGSVGSTLRMAGGERGGGAIYNPTALTLGQGTLVARFKPAQAISGGTTRPYVVVRATGPERGLMLGMSGGSSSHAYGAVSSSGWIFASGNGVDESVWRTVGVNVDPASGGNVQGWLEGAFHSSTAYSGAAIGGSAPTQIWFGRDPTGYFGYPTGDVGWVGYWHRLLGTGEHRLLHEDPWSLVAPASLVQGWRFAAAGGATHATAPGATATATVSLVAGAATAASAAAGKTVTATASLIAGAASASNAAPGATVTASASLVAGAATAASTAPGATVTATASVVAGAATAASTAAGATVAVAASLVAGAASSGATASGATVVATAALVAGAATAASTAPGATVSTNASLIAGSATGTGNGTAAGATVAATANLIAGAATAASTAAGVITTATASLVAGAASAASTAAGATVTVSASIIAGSASGAGNATAPAATLQAIVSLIAGSPIAASTAAGATVSGAVSLIPGAAASHYTAAGATLPSGASLIPGTATAASQSAGATVVVGASLIPGAAFDSSAATAAGAIIGATAILLPGRPQVGGVNRDDPTPTPAIARGALTGAVPRTSATPVIPR